MKLLMYSTALVFMAKLATAQTNTGIGVIAPSHKLHVVGAAATDPVRLETLQAPATTDLVGTIVATNTGVLKLQNANTKSAVWVTGSLTFAANNTEYSINTTVPPVETFDNLNEYAGDTFTALQAGLYEVALKINFLQRVASNDGADGYTGYGYIRGPVASSISAGKIYLPEVGGSTAINSVLNTDLVKLTAGQTVRFSSLLFGATGGNTCNCQITINRID